MANVYKCDSNWYYSDGITRDFGVNKIITLLDGSTIFCVVQPLVCNPDECGLVLVGTIDDISINSMINVLKKCPGDTKQLVKSLAHVPTERNFCHFVGYIGALKDTDLIDYDTHYSYLMTLAEDIVDHAHVRKLVIEVLTREFQ